MAATNTWHFGNGELVMGNELAVDNYRLPITYYFFKELANPHRKRQTAYQDALSEFQVSNAAYFQIYRVHSWVWYWLDKYSQTRCLQEFFHGEKRRSDGLNGVVN